jgi:predicted DNA-binding transcriptional regulator AlpA
VSGKGKFAKIPDPLPDWFRYLANDAYASAADLGRLFGVSGQAIFIRSRDGDFPAPVHFGQTWNCKGGVGPLTRWLVSDVRKWIAMRRKEGRCTA